MPSSPSKIISIALFTTTAFSTPTQSFTATEIMMTTSPHYHIRPYDPSRDQSSLEEICANIYNGSDYLPKVANNYVKDDSCSFLALATKRAQNNDPQQQQQEEDGQQDDRIIAVANYKRLPAQNAAWIEAVRTHSNYRNQGLASKLLQSIIELAKEEDNHDTNNNNNSNSQQHSSSPTNILTCTIKSNKGMQRVFDKLGFVPTNTIPILSFSILRQLPGWDAKDDNDDTTKTTTISQVKPLLPALDLYHLLSPNARSIPASLWTTVTSEMQLLELLNEMQREGGTCGFLPGLHEYIVPGPNRMDLKQSLERGLVLVLTIPLDDKEMSGCCCDGGDVNDTTNNNNERSLSSERAILAFTQDERIQSLKSKWVCSISAYSTLAFEAALHHAHSSEIAQRINNNGSSTTEIRTTEVVVPPFCLAFDDAVPMEEGTIAHALPRVDDECIVFQYKPSVNY
jgi:GNAT superfamily N-acetyltransferase